MAKKNKKKSNLKKYPRGGSTNPPIITHDPNDPRLQAYRDSLDLYNMGENSYRTLKSLSSKYSGNALVNEWRDWLSTDDGLENNYMGELAARRLDNYNGQFPTRESVYNPSSNVYAHRYKQPSQPIIYQPTTLDPTATVPTSRVVPSTTSTYKSLAPIREKQIPIEDVQQMGIDLPTNQLGDINLIPFTPGTYFTRPRQRQEEGYGELVDYFDKKTGKPLGTYKSGGSVSFQYDTYSDDFGDKTLELKRTESMLAPKINDEISTPYKNPYDAALLYEKEALKNDRNSYDVLLNRFIYPWSPQDSPLGSASIFRKGMSPIYGVSDKLGFNQVDKDNRTLFRKYLGQEESKKETIAIDKVKQLGNLTVDEKLGNLEFGGNIITEKENIELMKKGGKIKIKESKKGTFKAQASKMGMGVQEAASKILNAPEGKYSPAMRKKANFAKNFTKADGGYPEVGGDLMNQSQNNFLTNIKPIDSEPVITEMDYNMQPFPELDIQNPYKFDPALTKSLERQSGNKPILTPEEQSQYDQYNKFKNTKFSEVAPYIPTNSLFNNYYLNRGNQFRKKAIDSFSKLEDGGFGGGDYWNLGSGIANAITADINTAKGYTDIFGTLNVNRQIKAIEAQNKRANLLSQFENPTPTFQSGWGGNNPLDNGYIPVGENGMSIKEMGGNGLPNVEIEGKENVKLPNGFSENVSGKTHAEGGIPLNLQVGSQILSEKLKHPETGKSYAKMAKKFQTKKDFKHLESKYSDPLNIKTAELNIQMKNEALDNLFIEQEKNKITGKHGTKIKESTLEDYTMKNGGMKKYGPGGANWNQEVFDTPYGYLTPTGIDLNKTPLTNWEQIRDAWQTSRNRQYSDFGELQEDIYDTKLDEAEAGDKKALEDLRKMWETFGITNKDEKQYSKYQDKINKGQELSIQDLKDLRGNYIDYRRGKRSLLPTSIYPKVDFKTKAPVKQSDTPSAIDKITPVEGQKSKKGYSPIIAGLQFPDAYLRDPITVNNLQPEFYQPSTISPYLNDIQRLQYASNANLGTSGAELATRANLFGQGLTEYGKRYYDTNAFNAQAKTQAAAQNAQTKQRVNEYNMSNYIQNARNPQLQREAVITEQKALNRNAQLKQLTDMEHEQRVQDYLADIYNPEYAFNANYNPYLSQKPKAKYGTKIKLKNKKKK